MEKDEEEDHRPLLALGVLVPLGLVALGIIAFAMYNLAFGPRSQRLLPDEEHGESPNKTPHSEMAQILKISHSLPEIQLTSSICTDKVVRQSTLPAVSQRHLRCFAALSLGHFRPELYPAVGPPDSRPFANCDASEPSGGKLHFALRYDHEVEGLMVKVLQATDLTPRDFNGCWDPYVKVHLLPDHKKFQTKVQRRERNPVFNETFVFPVVYSQLASRTLNFSVYSLDRFSRHDLMGQVAVRGLLDSCDLSHQVEYVMDVISCERQGTGKSVLGELMVSLCFLPTAGRLTVTVIKGRNLKSHDEHRACDPYVKVWMVCHGQRMKKKKTTVKKATANPVYNEALVFDVPADIVDHVRMVVKVIDYDRVGSNEVLGCCTVCGQHWFEMLDGPRKPVAQWYPLSETVPDYGRPPTALNMGCLNGR